jgi:hypothetical protein
VDRAEAVAAKVGRLVEATAKPNLLAGALGRPLALSAGPFSPTDRFCQAALGGCKLAAMSATRGREAKLKAEYAGLYPELEPGVWIPVEKLLGYITELIHQDRSRSGIITGDRLLREEHFDYRGASVRPAGLPAGSTRLSDSGAAPDPTLEAPGEVPAEKPVHRRARRE